MLFELHQDNTFCTSVVKVSTNVSIEWLDVPIVVSSANMSAEVLVSERGRSFTLHPFLSLTPDIHISCVVRCNVCTRSLY